MGKPFDGLPLLASSLGLPKTERKQLRAWHLENPHPTPLLKGLATAAALVQRGVDVIVPFGQERGCRVWGLELKA